ncbi:hypothetical protein AB0L82_43370, partial [Nocardia sp. NPDC052001]|uniref:hypothetical protein n=1 Tax=Nocardia sp. NPDC052001 TaxID=3154853 RepID=UPI0034151FA2
PQTDPLAHVRKLQQELRQGAPRVARPDSPHTPEDRSAAQPDPTSIPDQGGKVPYVLDSDQRKHFRENREDWKAFVADHVPADRQDEWLTHREQVLDHHETIANDINTALRDTNSPLVWRQMATMQPERDATELRTEFAKWWVNGGAAQYIAERNDRGVPERAEHNSIPHAPKPPASDHSQRPQAPETPERDSVESDRERERQISDLTAELARVRGERDEAVAKLVRRTPAAQRYGSPQRRAAERPETPEAPDAPEAPESPDREELPTDRDEIDHDRSDLTDLGSTPDWSGIPEPPEPPDLEPLPARGGGWDGFER